MTLLNLQAFPHYSTSFGAAYLGNSLDLMAKIPDDSIDLICTSPPFALLRPKEYGNVSANDYVEWFLPFAKEFHRIIKSQGSIAIDIGGTWNKGTPTRSLYHYELLIELCKSSERGGLGFYLAQELYWYNPAKLPTPAQWVTIERTRVKDAVNTVWWLSKTPHPKANNRRVLKPYSNSMKSLLKNGYKAKVRPSGHNISEKFGNDNKGAIPGNLIASDQEDIGYPVSVVSASNTSSNDSYQRRCKENEMKPHPARFPQALPEFLINLCTEPGDVVLDPFAGSNTTGCVAQSLGRRWIALELSEEYLNTSKFRFEDSFNDKEKHESQPGNFDFKAAAN